MQLLQGDITRDWPRQGFDHILLCDVAYYLAEAQLRQLAVNIQQQAQRDCVVLLAHWRHGFAQVLTPTETAHRLFEQASGLQRLAHYEDEDLLIDVWSRGRASVARKEGLL
ncbi:hypothetical protein D3C85_1463650 [compost metagenome]